MKNKKICLLPYGESEGRYHTLFSQNALYALASYLQASPELSAHLDLKIVPWPLSHKHFFRDLFMQHSDLILYLRKERPLMVCFSLYALTLLPCYRLAKTIKEVIPEITIVAGGPEIIDRQTFSARYPAFDVLVEGAGEVPFRKLMEALILKEVDYSGIPNISFREPHGRMVHNDLEVVPDDPSLLSNAFAGFYSDLQGDAVWMRARGCKNNCSYCGWAGQPRWPKPPGLVTAELEAILSPQRLTRFQMFDSDVMDTVDEAPEAYEAMRATLARYGCPPMTVFIRPASLVHPRLEETIHELNITEIYIGLQSLNHSTLRAIGRGWQIEQHDFLAEAPSSVLIRAIPQLMVPLPEETPESFYNGIRELVALGYLRLHVFSTLVLPGTRLRRDASRLGIRHYSSPPYLCFETPTFSVTDVLEAQAVGQVYLALEDHMPFTPREAYQRMQQIYSSRTDLFTHILNEYRKTGTWSGCQAAIAEEFLSEDTSREGTGDVTTPRAVPTGDQPLHSSIVEASICREDYPDEKLLRNVIARYNLEWVEEHVAGDECILFLNGEKGSLRIAFFPADSARRRFGEGGNIAIAYSGSLPDLKLMHELLALCRNSVL